MVTVDDTGDTGPPPETSSELDTARSQSGASGSLTEKLVRAAIHQRLFGGEAPSLRVGRYVVLDKIGQGGMGIVYTAYDPELDRKIALKFLRPLIDRSDEHARSRLMREAQAMARLAHPNVVHVYEVGAYEDAVYIAMAFVRGTTLAAWLRDANPSWREILERFIAAGHGLVAAHAANIVHRDFKPENVLIDESGRPQVSDFGSARETAWDPADASNVYPLPSATSSSQLANSLTASGVLLGTPAYMSPEQHAGKPADARSDQYSFCVALFEALYGERPFRGNTREQLAAAMAAEQITVPAGRSGVPTVILVALRRGLAWEPSARYRDMGELLTELEHHAHPRRTRMGPIAIATGMVALGVAGVTVIDRDPACVAQPASLATQWSGELRSQLEQRFVGTAADVGYPAWRATAQALDTYVQSWTDASARACADTYVHGRYSAITFDRRSACLHDRQREFETVVDALEQADVDLVERGPKTVYQLTHPRACDDVVSLERGLPPIPPGADLEIRTTREELANAHGLAAAGRYTAALETVVSAHERATASNYPPLLAEVLAERGFIEGLSGESTPAIAHLDEAIDLAEIHHHDGVSARAWALQLGLHAKLDQPGPVEALYRRTDVAITRAADPDDLRAAALADLAYGLYLEGRPREAISIAERSLQLRQQAQPTDLGAVAQSMNTLATVLEEVGDRDRALGLYEQALAMNVSHLGEHHPDVGRGHLLLGMALADVERLDEAERHYVDAERIYTALTSDQKRYLGYVASGRSEIELGRRNYDHARAHAQRANEIWQGLDEGDPLRADALRMLGRIEFAAANYSASLESYRDALAVLDARREPGSINRLRTIAGIAAAHAMLGATDDALAELDRALPELVAALGENNLYVIGPRLHRALILNERGEHEPAMAEFEAALRAATAAQHHASMALARAELAPLISRYADDERRANELSSAARRYYEAHPENAATGLVAIQFHL